LSNIFVHAQHYVHAEVLPRLENIKRTMKDEPTRFLTMVDNDFWLTLQTEIVDQPQAEELEPFDPTQAESLTRHYRLQEEEEKAHSEERKSNIESAEHQISSFIAA